jgi:hypothetical protein
MKKSCSALLLGALMVAAAPAVAVTPVLWDVTHGVFSGYEPSGRFSDLAAMLTGMGYTIETTNAGIDNIDLSPYAVLVVCNPSSWDTPYTPAEAAAAVAFAGSGGSILILGEDFGSHPDHVNPIAQAFGTTVGVDDVVPTDLYFDNFASHPVFDGITTLYYRAGGELAVDTALPIAWAPTGEILVTAAAGHRVVTLGDASAFTNDYLGNADNGTFAAAVFTWLHAPAPVESATWGGVKVCAGRSRLAPE